jgi:hypothetical protein
LAQELLYLLKRALGILQIVASALYIAALKRGASLLQNIIQPDGGGFDVAAETEALLLNSLFDGPHPVLRRSRSYRDPVDAIA